MRRKTVKIPKDVASLSHRELVGLLHELLEVIEAQQAELEKHRRAGKRRAAPFSKEKENGESEKGKDRKKEKKTKKKPGRKPGEGPFTNRQPPAADEVTEQIDVPSSDCCPDCGSSDLEFDHYEYAWITNLPEPKPKVRQFRKTVCRCKHCGKKDIRGSHPDVPEDQRGATAHRVGSDVYIAAHVVHYGFGVPVCKTPAILEELTGVKVTQSAITQDALRRAEKPMALEEYQRLRKAIQQAPVAQTDDTGYRKNGKPAQLMVFTTPDTPDGPGTTVYQIREQHRNEEVREVIPGDYEGVMVTDRGRSYDAKEFDEVKQQKCIFHVGRSIDEVLETKSGPARKFGELLLMLLDDSLRLWQSWQDGKRRGYKKKAVELEEMLTLHLEPRELTDPDNQRLLNELGRHHARGNLVRFLRDPNIPPTNNLSEQELRLAIQARKVSHCVKNERGARAHEVHSSIIRTEQRKRPKSLIDAVKHILLGPQPQAPPLS
jgi:hypothetical protein